MLYFLASMLIMLALLDRALRIGRLESLRLETRFRLFALRDELRRGGFSGAAPQNKWFEYLDTTITKAIDVLPHINAWEALALLAAYAKDKSVWAAHIELSEALEQPENHALSEVYDKYLDCIVDLLAERHRTSGRVLVTTARAVGRMAHLKNRLAEIITIAPETSTLLNYR